VMREVQKLAAYCWQVSLTKAIITSNSRTNDDDGNVMMMMMNTPPTTNPSCTHFPQERVTPD